jgi:hypothetical protein
MTPNGTSVFDMLEDVLVIGTMAENMEGSNMRI